MCACKPGYPLHRTSFRCTIFNIVCMLHCKYLRYYFIIDTLNGAPMTEFVNAALQHIYHAFHPWESPDPSDEAPVQLPGVVDLPAAAHALERPLAVIPCTGRDVDAELAAGDYPYSRRRSYRVHLPPDHDPTIPLPLIMVLHGCRQTHLDIQQISQFDAIAERERAIVVYPWVTGYLGMRTLNCWGWWIRGHRKRGQGEVEDLARIAREVVSTYAVQPNRRFICGLSSGACMSVISLVAASDTWTAGASVAGVAYGEDARAVRISRYLAPRFRQRSELLHGLQLVHGKTPPPPLLIVQSTADEVVSITNAEHLLDQWLSASSLSSSTSYSSTGRTQGRDWQMQAHHDERLQLRTLYFTIEQLIHGWFGGAAGSYSTPDAPNLSELIWWFFSQQSSGSAPATVIADSR